MIPLLEEYQLPRVWFGYVIVVTERTDSENLEEQSLLQTETARNRQDRQQVADTEMLIQTQRGCGRILNTTASTLGGAQARSTAGHWWHSRSNRQTKESRGN